MTTLRKFLWLQLERGWEASPLAYVTQNSFSDPDAYEAAVRTAQPSGFVTMARGDFQAQLAHAAMGRLRIQLGVETLARSAFIAIPEDRCPIVFLADDRMPPLFNGGVELGPDALLVNRPGSTAFHRTLGPHRWAGMSLSLDDLAEVSATIAGREIRAPTCSLNTKPSPDSLHRLRQVHSDAISFIETNPEVFSHPEAGKALEHSLIVAMIACLIQEPCGETANGWRRSRMVMRQFERWLEANLDRPVHLLEICTVLGVPARTLKHYSHEHLGMGPTEYLRLRRMKMARRALQHAEAGASVSRVAAQFGFWELGRFAGAYRALFGELPSTTLARSRLH